MNSLIFGNPAGMWALLGLPVVIAIHFLQPRSRRAVVTTLFLLDHLPPQADTGRAWRWLRSSWALWLQLLAVVLLAWLLADPRWLRPDATQTIAIVLDATASMRAFRADAESALAERMPAWEHGAARTEWVVRETELTRPVLYRGYDRSAALAALAQWQPDRVGHAFTPALEIARQLVRRSGAVALVTDRVPEPAPSGIALLAVGRPLDNAGFAGGTVAPGPGGLPQWSVLVQHHGTGPAERVLEIAARNGTMLRNENIALEPGQLRTLSGAFPESAGGLIFRLRIPDNSQATDALDLDDTLALLVPQPRALSWGLLGDAESVAFFRTFLERTPGLAPAAVGETPDIAVIAAPIVEGRDPNRSGDTPVADGSNSATGMSPLHAPHARLFEIRVHRPAQPAANLATGTIAVDNHAWVDGLAWSGLLSPGPVLETLPAGARALLWQGRAPLAWIENSEGAGVTRLVLGWDWAASNAERLPAAAVLLHRAIESVRTTKLAPESRNVDAGQLIEVALPEGDGSAAWSLEIDGQQPSSLSATALAALRAPASAAFFVVRRNSDPWLTGATQFADPREGDFSAAATRLDDLESTLDPLEVRSEGDRLQPLWILLLLGVLLVSWWVQAPRAHSEQTSGVPEP